MKNNMAKTVHFSLHLMWYLKADCFFLAPARQGGPEIGGLKNTDTTRNCRIIKSQIAMREEHTFILIL